jgi:hypothetical protein
VPARVSYQSWSAADLEKLRLWTAENVPYPEQARRLQRPVSSVRQKARALGLRHPNATLETKARSGLAEEPPPAHPEFSSPLTREPLSVEDIVRLFRIDLEVWEPYHVQPNVWQMGASHPETGKILTENLYQTKVRFRRLPEAGTKELADALIANIEAATKARTRIRPKLPAPPTNAEPHMLEVDLFDVHINKLAWIQEAGENYDSAIAEDRARAAMADLLAMARPYYIEAITLPIGNDFTNIDGLLKQTTAGTPQDTDTRYHRMFTRAHLLASWMIETCAQVAPVEVVIVPGNHDELTAWTLGQVLQAEYRHDSRVRFQGGPMLRKYVEYGANLIGYTHGVDEPHGNLPQIMAVEEPDKWSRSKYREWHVGHLHKQKATQPVTVDDKIGVTVRIIRSLSGTDAWHKRKGYVGGTHGAEGFVWQKSGGIRAHLYHTAEKSDAA